MVLPSSGQITASQINVELGKSPTAAFSINDTDNRTLAGKPSGQIAFSDFHGKANEYVVTLSSSISPVLTSFISESIWGNADIVKRVVIPAGVEIGASYTGHALATSQSANLQAGSWAGTLIIENHGTISGYGGAANSGTGGTALLITFPGRNGESCQLYNYGTIRAGGGGGGRGGNGGNGTYTGTQVEGPFFSNTAPLYRVIILFGTTTWYWNGATVTGTRSVGADGKYILTSSDGWTYYEHEFVGGLDSSIRRERPIAMSSTGGIGGDGGRGQGSDGANAAGANGTAGGTNAGAGGTGGTGGDWGATGATGNTGASGNAGSGTAGAAGGLSGFWLNGATRTTVFVPGTVLGRSQ